MKKRKLNNEELNKILELKSGMNSQRLQFNINNLPNRPITSSRLLGFVEGDGSFCIPNMRPTLSIKQHSKNIHFYMKLRNF